MGCVYVTLCLSLPVRSQISYHENRRYRVEKVPAPSPFWQRRRHAPAFARHGFGGTLWILYHELAAKQEMFGLKL